MIAESMICKVTGHLNNTGFDVERCVYCGEPVDAEAARVIFAARELRKADALDVLAYIQAVA